MYCQIDPDPSLRTLIECYWIVENEDPTIRREKIIPDGFPEMIFHYGDPYRINLDGVWKLQTKNLLAGQIRRHFYLENTGRSGMVGIKFFPTSLRHLYGISMERLTDRVADLYSEIDEEGEAMGDLIRTSPDHEKLISLLNSYFRGLAGEKEYNRRAADKAVRTILETRGLTTVSELTKMMHMGERSLERLFREYVGLPPKLYSRIIRFNSIFLLKQQNKHTWTDLVYETGYYDQSHFIKEFKQFSGEDPSAYLFDNMTMANFFLNRPR